MKADKDYFYGVDLPVDRKYYVKRDLCAGQFVTTEEVQNLPLNMPEVKTRRSKLRLYF